MNSFVVVACIVVLGLAALQLGLLPDRVANTARIAIALPATIYFVSIAASHSGARFWYASLFAVLALVILLKAVRRVALDDG